MKTNIPPALSLYLDLVRFLAAVVVVIYHTWPVLFPAIPVKWPGHEAVVVFFVLSGYVICHAATRPGITWAEYARHRIARIIPVAYLALALGVVLVLVGAEQEAGESAVLRPTIANTLFVAQSAHLTLDAPYNAPFWSLNYEVWYYVIFGAWMFSPRRWRNAAVAGALLLAGPKILMLFPVWLYGVWLYRSGAKFGERSARLWFAVTLVVAAALTWLNVSEYLRAQLYAAFAPAWRAHFSTQFIYDILLGVVVTANFAAVIGMGPVLKFLLKAEKPIRYLASFTFSVYVFHSPLKVLLFDVCGIHAPLPFYAAMMGCIYILAELTERRVKFFRALLEPRRSVPAPAS